MDILKSKISVLFFTCCMFCTNLYAQTNNNGSPYCVIDKVEHASNYDVAFEAGTITSDGYYLYFSTIYNGREGRGRTHVTR